MNQIQLNVYNLPALIIDLVILANEILETHIFPTLLLLIKEAFATRHVEDRPHPCLGEVLLLQDRRP